MKCVIIILFITGIFTRWIEIVEGNDQDTDTKFEEEINREVPCLGRNCIYKCCPYGQCVMRMQCISCNGVPDFSLLRVFDRNIIDTGKTVPHVFEILPGSLGDHAVNVNKIEFIPYIIEDGTLQLEMPNTYNRWTLVQNRDFCVDHLNTTEGTLTNLPQIWAVVQQESLVENENYMTAATYVSCVFLLLVLVVYMLLPELQNLCGMILMAYVASLFLAFLLLAIIQSDRYEDNVCIGLTVGIYYFFLASFCWMNVMSYDIWWTFRGYAKAKPIHRRGETFKLFLYCSYAWGLPFLMAIGLFVLNIVDMSHVPWFITPHVPTTGCFLEGGVKLLYLYTPMLILILCNWMFYLMTAYNIWRLSRGTAVLDSAAAGTPAAHRSQRNRLMVYLKLSVVMGVSWLFEIISFRYPEFKGWYISDIYNILIGVLIFLIFVCKKETYRKLYKRYAFFNTRRFYPRSSKSNRRSSSGSSPETTTLQICANPNGFNGYPGLIKSL